MIADPPSGRRGITRVALLAGILAVLVLGYFIKTLVAPQYRFCDACITTGAVACGAPGCEHGRVLCSAPCLKKESPGWALQSIPDQPPDLLWMELVDADGARSYISQNHLGEVVEYSNGRWVRRGRCTVCKGSTRMICPSCQAKRPCPECGGKGKLRRWF